MVQSKKKHKILIAEDAPVQGKRLKYFLEKYLYQVEWALNGREALERLEKEDGFALVISDFKMPEMDGIEFLKEMKLRPHLKHIPFILLTTFDDDELYIQTLMLGANEFLSKPFRPEELKVRVENMVMVHEYLSAIENQNLNLSHELQYKNQLLKRKLIDLKNAYVRQKEMQNELMLRSKLSSLGTMGAGVAHEINNPLTIINSYNSMLGRFLAENKTDPKNLAKVQEKIEDAVHRISEVINQLQLLSIKNSTEETKADAITIEMMLNDARPFIIDSAEREQIAYSETITHPQAMIYADSAVIKQIILSITHNAIDAMIGMETRELKLRSRAESNFVFIDIEDSGTGIPEEYQSKIYDPFFTTKTPKKGMGLGLTLVKTYIQESQGHISFTSEPGKTIFTLKFMQHYPAKKGTGETNG